MDARPRDGHPRHPCLHGPGPRRRRGPVDLHRELPVVILASVARVDSLTTLVGVPLSIVAVGLLVATDFADWRGRRLAVWQSLIVVLAVLAWAGVLFYRFAVMAP